jgi:hypothetical protein
MRYQRISFFLKPVGSEPVLFWGYFVEGSGAHSAVLATAQAEVWKAEWSRALSPSSAHGDMIHHTLK